VQDSILLVEDEEKVAQIIKAYLEKEGYTVKIATDGQSALEAVKTFDPELIILDRMLPKVSGDLICAQLRQEGDIPILMLSALTSEEDRVFGLRIGADDYLTKPFSPRELVTRVMALLRRAKRSPRQSLLSFMGGRLQINPGKYEVMHEGKPVNLTPTEFQLLLLLVTHPGQVFRRERLLEQVQGANYTGYERTIDAHIKNIRRKIEPHSARPVYIQTVFGVGYRFIPEPDRQP